MLSLNDLNSFLGNLDPHDARMASSKHGGSLRPAPTRSKPGSGLRAPQQQQMLEKGSRAPPPLVLPPDPPQPPQPFDPSIPPQFQHLSHKAVKAALSVMDRIVSQAVRTGEVSKWRNSCL